MLRPARAFARLAGLPIVTERVQIFALFTEVLRETVWKIGMDPNTVVLKAAKRP